MSKMQRAKQVENFVERIVRKGFEDSLINERQLTKVNRLASMPFFKKLAKKTKEENSMEAEFRSSTISHQKDAMREDSPFASNKFTDDSFEIDKNKNVKAKSTQNVLFGGNNLNNSNS